MSEDRIQAANFLARNKLTGVALTMLLQAIVLGVLGVLGTWWLRGETSEFVKVDALMQRDIGQLESRVSNAEHATDRTEEKVLREIKEMRAEVNQRIDRIEDKLDRRGNPR